ncbi:polyadenylate-binding protein-interacting protein 1 isoform X2 [Drosophila rhopaloa]|nr:polyadenylate-binding protein-interacting protein 1 isoform X2 [Drosophila rhopaloa]XP_016988818.1 polyadenylate-binding protein-interacting protein 1 isoform X2 [Drosophila rhopaloa]XP_016988819.1 polyadenylate-binding protein-interacting protein 1 isoform X2 [Drosophila rhopaloa]XP_016988820.1 polyadenylate-binding protein-interacting protein 1 isoform X2 [Drosophila rhopaloa]
MSCRAPFQPDDQYEQMRRPNVGAGSGGVAMPGLEQQAHLFGEYGQAYGQAQVAGGYQQQLPVQAIQAQAQTLSDLSKLSPAASVFVPRGVAPPQQQQSRHQQYQQAGGAGGSGGAPYGQQRYVNGYKHHHQQQHHQQPHYNHHHNHQQKFNNDMQKITNSVQNRLHLNSQQGSAGNYYQQQQQQVHPQNTHHHQQQQHNNQQQHQPHNQHAKFQRHTHLNNSFQQIAQQTQHHQQPHHQQHSQQQQQQYFQNQNQNQQQQQPQPSTSSAAASSSSSNSSQPDMATIALEYLDTVIHCLNQNPGQFDTIASRFLTIFDGMENNHYVLSIAMEDIFEKSIEQPNFRYMGAKLYNLLHMLNPKPDSLFHTLLKCKLDYHQKEVTKYMRSNEQQKVRETALFLAELYMQLRGDDDSRIQLIAVNIVYSLSKLLLSESNENVRCLCQTLKLAGYDLSADCPKDMLEIITALQAIELKSPGKYAMAASVIALQQNNWGRKVSNALGGDEDIVTEPLRLSDEPVFYGPDGRELTAEETDFLATEDGDGSDGDDFDADVGDLEMDAEMDEETERAYKEFCKQGMQNKT